MTTCLQGGFYGITEAKVFPSLSALIDFHRTTPLSIYYASISTTLDIPAGDQRRRE